MRRRLLSIVGALGLVTGLLGSAVAVQAETEPPSFGAMIWTWSTSTQNVCYSNSGTAGVVGGVCTIKQLDPSAHAHVAVCVQNNVPGGGTCLITQTGTTKDNRAIVLQRNTQSQTVRQDVTLTQGNESARNDAWVGQIVSQSTDSPGRQIQIARQFDTINQTATSGGQKVLFGQLSTQRENSTTGDEQDQFSDQDANYAGRHINQTTTLDGISEATVGEAQIQTATGLGIQNQYIDPRCCSQQRGNKADRFRIGQFVYQKNNATPNEDPQDATSVAECHTDGNCSAFQSTTNNTASRTNSCSGKDCTAVIHCGPLVEGGCSKSSSTTCTVECAPAPVCPEWVTGCASFGLAHFSNGAFAMAPVARGGSSFGSSRSASRYAGAARSAPSVALLT